MVEDAVRSAVSSLCEDLTQCQSSALEASIVGLRTEFESAHEVLRATIDKLTTEKRQLDVDVKHLLEQQQTLKRSLENEGAMCFELSGSVRSTKEAVDALQQQVRNCLETSKPPASSVGVDTGSDASSGVEQSSPQLARLRRAWAPPSLIAPETCPPTPVKRKFPTLDRIAACKPEVAVNTWYAAIRSGVDIFAAPEPTQACHDLVQPLITGDESSFPGLPQSLQEPICHDVLQPLITGDAISAIPHQFVCHDLMEPLITADETIYVDMAPRGLDVMVPLITTDECSYSHLKDMCFNISEQIPAADELAQHGHYVNTFPLCHDIAAPIITADDSAFTAFEPRKLELQAQPLWHDITAPIITADEMSQTALIGYEPNRTMASTS